MNNDCTQEFLDLKNPMIIISILSNLKKSALIIFLQHRGLSITSLKKMSKTRLVEEVIKTFNLRSPGCNAAKKEFYYNILKPQESGTSFCLSSIDRSLIQKLVNTKDLQARHDILNALNANTIYMLSSSFGIPNAKNMDIEELRKILIKMSSKPQTSSTPSPNADQNDKECTHSKEAAARGHLECLKDMYKKYGTADWNEQDCISAAASGYLNCLKYLHEKGCPWDEQVCYRAAEYGNLDCLKYAHENGCPWNKLTCEYAIMAGNLDCLEYAHKNGCPWDEQTCATAADDIEFLKYLHENGCPWDKRTCEIAASAGNLECLEYAHKKGCPWDKGTCNSAALTGQLDCLKYAHKKGCPWDETTCAAAVQFNELDCLKYLHENGCPWDERTCEIAVMHNSLACLKYARENGCPEKPCTIAAVPPKMASPLPKMASPSTLLQVRDSNVSPLVAHFLNARTIADRRDILKNLDKRQLFVLATYFKILDYKTQTRENIINKLLYNIPPPNVTSIKTGTVSLVQKIINGFSNAQTVSTRKDYLNTLDKQSLFILAEHYEIPNYQNKKREEIFNDLVYKTPSTPVVSTVSLSCNMPKNVQFFSEKEKQLVKAFINATTIISKKKLLNSLQREDLLILAQKFNIYGASSLNIAQLREQLFKNELHTSAALTQKFELAQNPEQRKEILNFLDKRGLMALAKKYNIPNINKMPAESIRTSLLGLPYLKYKSSSCDNACQTPAFTAGGTFDAASPYVATNRNIISPSPAKASSPSISVLKTLSPPLSPNDKIITPFRTRQLENLVPSSNSPKQPLYTTSGCQVSLDRDFLQTNANVLLSPSRTSRQSTPAAPAVPSRFSFEQQTSPVVATPPRQATASVVELSPQVIKTVPTSFTKTPLKIKSIEPILSPASNRSTSTVYTSPQMSNRSTSTVYTSPQMSNKQVVLYTAPQTSSKPKSSPLKLTSSELALLIGSNEVGRNKVCSADEESVSTVEISNLVKPNQDFLGLHNLLDNLQQKFGQTREKAIQNQKIIKQKIDDYLKSNSLQADDGNRVTVNNHSFYSNGVLLLGDEGTQVEELKSRMPYINWSAISGIIGVGLVHLYSWMLYNMAGSMFGPSTAAGFNITDAYIPQGGMQTGIFAPGALKNNFEPFSLSYDNTTNADFNVPNYVPQGGMQTGIFAPGGTNNAALYSLPFNTAVGFSTV